jgi:hypothetical protein
MSLVYLVNKPQVSRRIVRWLLLFSEYDFIVVYKPSRLHVIINALSKLPYITNPQMCLIKPQIQVCFTQSLNGEGYKGIFENMTD